MARSRRAQARQAQQLRWGILIGLGVVAALLALGYMVWRGRSERVELVASNQCPSAGAHGVVVILIDQTDPLSDVTRQDLEQQLAGYTNGVKRHEALYIYALRQDGRPERLFFGCNPGSAADANEMIESKQRAERSFQTRFRKPLDQALREVLRDQNAKASPIMESVQAIAVQTFSDPANAGAERRLLVIASDFMQLSPRVSFYGQGSGVELGERALDALRAPLREVEADLLFISRPDEPGPPHEALRTAWSTYLHGSESGRVKVVRLTGANP